MYIVQCNCTEYTLCSILCSDEELCCCGFERQSHTQQARDNGTDDSDSWTLEDNVSSDRAPDSEREALGSLPPRGGLRPIRVRSMPLL